MRARHQRNREDASIKAAAWRARNSERLKESRRAYYGANRDRIKAVNKHWRETHPEWVAHAKVAWRHNLTLDGYLKILNEANGKCMICQGPEKTRSRLSLDHDHACCSGKTSCGTCIRGLLCGSCNVGLSRFRDDPSLLLAAIEYLKNPPLLGQVL